MIPPLQNHLRWKQNAGSRAFALQIAPRFPFIRFVQIRMTAFSCHAASFTRLLCRLDFKFKSLYTDYADNPHFLVLYFMRYTRTCQYCSQIIQQYIRTFQEASHDIR